MGKQFYKDAFGWGFVLWLIGYILGFVFYAFAPASAIGWVIMPIGIALALWILVKKVKGDSFRYYVMLAVAWALVAIVLDYFLLVKTLKPADGYYKLDVFLYYGITFILPLIIGWRKNNSTKQI